MTIEPWPGPDYFWWEGSPRRVRTLLGSSVVADSQEMHLLHPPGGRPAAYYFPESDVHMDLLTPSSQTETHAQLGPITYWDVHADGKTRERAARAYRQPPEQLKDLAGFVTIDWNAMDAWFEEDEEVFVHPRDPYHRVDIRQSSRHVRVEIHGQTVAETRRPCILFETNHPVRYYIPLLDVNLTLLTPSETRTGCAYKGYASYYSANINDKLHDDIAWAYVFPFAECAKIANYVSFYNEKVDIYLDGELQPRPQAGARR
jgi:uncharacterized protein (DUF427 family)